MKKVLSIVLALAMLCFLSVTAFALTGESGPYNPITRDEIQKGTVLDFDSVEEDFGTTVYYVKLLGEDKQEHEYALAKRVYIGDVLYDAAEIADMDLGEITFVLRSEKIKYINPVMPDGLFDAFEVTRCYCENDTIYAIVEFENIVDEFKLIMATYNDKNEMCSVKSFDISYMDSYYELDMSANGGDRVKLFLWESVSGLVPLCEINKEYIPTEYGYLIALNEADGEYTFEIFTTDGNVQTFECAEKVAINGESFLAGDTHVADRLEFSAESANKAYEDETNAVFHQPVMYAVNEQGEIAHIDTVVSSTNKGISSIIKDNDGDYYYRSYKEQLFKVSSNSFEDFKVKSDTKVIFVPDDRSNKAEYAAYESYKDIFVEKKTYHVEAYGLSPSYMASLVLVYKNDGEHIYPSSSPAMIVTSKVQSSDGIYIEGYPLTSNNIKHVKVNTDEVKDLGPVGKGDVIRYITDNSSEMIDYQLWYDASNSLQEESCASVDEAIANRILEVNATSTAPVVNCPNASFRLQYGTVHSLTLSNEGDSICVTPTIQNDKVDMATEGNGVVNWDIESAVKVFEYADGEVLTADLNDVIAGETEVIAYSSQGKLGMLYIIKKPYVSKKCIATIQVATERATGYEITGYGDGGRLITTVNKEEEPIVESIVKGNIIAYVPDGDTIKDIEVVFESTKDAFLPEDGASLIATDTDEILVFGLSEYTTDGAVVDGVKYTVSDDTNYLLMKYAGNIVNYGLGKHIEMKNEYVLIRVKADKPTEIADVVIFQGLN